MQTDCDVLIAGNGLAALTLALSLPESNRMAAGAGRGIRPK